MTAIDSLWALVDSLCPPADKPVRPIVTRTCGVCHGSGQVETGFEPLSNVGTSARCIACFGTGSVDVEVLS